MKTGYTKIIAAFILLFICAEKNAIAQNIFPATGRAGIYITAPAASLQVRGGARIGTTANYVSIDSATGNLSFVGTSTYRVAGNKYAFQYSGNPNYGLYFNSTNVQYEFRNGSAVPVFYINANNGNGVFTGNLKVGAYTLPATDGTSGQLLKTDGAGNISWATVSGGGGANTALSNLAATAVNVSLLPGTDSAKDIGSSLLSWKNIYLKDGLYFNGVRLMQYRPGVNTIIGENAGSAGTGGFNTAIGSNVLNINTTGNANVAIGEYGLEYNTTGSNNTATGYAALINNNAGSDNVANGFEALYNNSTGQGNTAVGKFSLFTSTTANENTAVGIYSLYANTTGNQNAAFGSYALQSNTSGSNNVAAGNSALYSNTTGNQNTALGIGALSSNTTGSFNAATGYFSLFSNSTGGNNTANGIYALYKNNGSYNSALGAYALNSNTTGNYNTGLGFQSLYNNTTGNNNTATGYNALVVNTTGNNNTATGESSLNQNTTGYENTATGSRALYNNVNGTYNTANGTKSLYSNIDGANNTAAGYSASYKNLSGVNNVSTGYYALYNNTSSYNTATGSSALYTNTTGYRNTATGYESLFLNTTGIENTATGDGALRSNTTGKNNTASGAYALNSNTTGNDNIAIGYQSLYSTITGSGNIGIGKVALQFNTSGSNNIIIGNGAGTDPSFPATSNAVAIGNGAVASSNQMSFGSYDVTDWTFGGSSLLEGRALRVGIDATNGNGAYLSEGGTWTNMSDKNLKEDFQKQDPQNILDKINKLPITKWKYKGANNEYHIGPVAQDFYKLFNLGLDDKSISTIDPAGVALLAIQALSKNNEQLQTSNATLKSQIQDLQSQINELKSMVVSVAQCCSKTEMVSSNVLSSASAAASLEQNIPNPFNQSTSINYTMPAKFSNAKIIVTDNNGKTIKQFTLSAAGKGSVSIAAGSLAGGLYHYALYVDGKMVDSKKMEIIR